MKPEAAFRAVVEQLQRIPNVAEKAYLAEEIFRRHVREARRHHQPDEQRVRGLGSKRPGDDRHLEPGGVGRGQGLRLRYVRALKASLSRAWLQGSSSTCCPR